MLLQLRDTVVIKIINTAKKLTNSSEESTNKFFRTLMFLIDHTDIAEEKSTL